ncbi:MAG: hypothetical protein M3O15_10145 [Acidobacteriota bacterium]|nr:hypothetical protein [Acidobacteriota bacterium]
MPEGKVEALRLAELLESVVRLSKVSVSEVERRLDYAHGTLSRIFAGTIGLKVVHIVDVVQAVGMEPRRFFELAFQQQGGDPVAGLLDAFNRLGRPLPAARTESISDDELDRRVEEALGRMGVVPIAPGAAEPSKKGAAKPRRQSRKPPTGAAP